MPVTRLRAERLSRRRRRWRLNKDDFDRDGNGVADFLEALIAGDVPSVVMSTRPDGFDGSIPDFRTGNTPSYSSYERRNLCDRKDLW